jgi:hypothetical protein
MPFFPESLERTKQTSEANPIERNMMIGLNELEIEEIASDLQLQTNILYYVAPSQDFPSLVRSVTFTNLDESNTLELDVLDGLAELIPNGLGK